MSSDDRKVEATNNKKIAFSLDYDNCSGILSKQHRKFLASHGQDKNTLSEIEEKYAANLTKLSRNAGEIYVFIGSNRQSFAVEISNGAKLKEQSKNKTKPVEAEDSSGFAMKLPPQIATQRSWKELNADETASNSQKWTGMKNRMSDFKQGPKTVSIRNTWHQLLLKNDGMAKASFLSLQLKAFKEKLADGEAADFYFIDDNFDILATVRDYFQNNPDKIPRGITLHICQFNIQNTYDDLNPALELFGTRIMLAYEKLEKENSPTKNSDVIRKWCALTSQPATYSVRACAFFNLNPVTTKINLMRLAALSIAGLPILTTYLLTHTTRHKVASLLWKNTFVTPNKVTLPAAVAATLLLMALVYYCFYRHNPELFLPREKKFEKLFEDGLKFPELTPTQARS